MTRSEPLLGVVGRGLPDSLFDFCRAPQQFALDLAREQGPVAWFRLTQELFAVLSEPNAVYAVLNGNPEDFEKGDLYELVRAVFGESIFTSDGSRWADLHAVIAPLFSRQRIRMLAGQVSTLSERVLGGWEELAGDKPLDLLTATKRLAFDVVRTLLGLPGSREADDLFAALDRADRIESVRLRYLGKRVPEICGPFRRSRLNDVVDGAAYAMAEHRLSETGGTDDLLGAAMASPLYEGLPEPGQRAFVRDFVASMFAAGYVSTGESIFWTFYLLATHPEIQARTREEIAGAGTDAARLEPGALPYLTAVYYEALRLYPPVWFLGRIARREVTVGGTEFPAGTRLLSSPFVVHRMEGLWPEPEEFRPERFLPGAKIAPKPFLPFGAGIRACLGRTLATMEATALIAATLSRFEVQIITGAPPALAAAFSLQPREAVLFRLTRL